METMEQQRHSLSSVPMLSRLDHLDFVVKFSFPSTMIKKRQQNLPKWKGESSSITRGLIGSGMMVREAYFKGSLLDRIATLDTRLLQICLELESSNASSNSIGESGETSSQRIKRDLTKTVLPIFNSYINPFHTPLQHPQDPRKNFANETCEPKKKTKSPKKLSRCNLLGC
ncbi:hypothetical protein BRARA_F03597 [Brassica rapa]|uniref:Uncharacterized protein n=1 Tax=Brassica campestris TaxID=3711 RepID=A0A397Z420_BRACM|nr:hypothetical protein BRARA_F03597 [Brassica rapa]